MTTAIHQQGISQQAGLAAMRIASLDMQLEDCKTMLKAAGDALKAEREELPAWAEYDGARTEFAADTKERREELRELAKAARDAMDKTDTGQLMQRERAAIRSIKARLVAARAEGRQLVMPFAEGVE
jgi:hypothetical protein